MSYANDMPTTEAVARTNAGLAAELRVGVMRLRRRLASERHPDNDLSLGQMAVLGLLLRRGELTIGELARLERVQPPSMTRTVTCLEDLGNVVRKPHETDGRVVVVSLTDHGRQVVLADRKRRDAWLAVQLTHLTADERAALRRAAPILDRLSQAD
jgi:DNA-binding MarR family transcriptional regulator